MNTSTLQTKEQEIERMLSDGYTFSQIQRMLSVDTSTVKNIHAKMKSSIGNKLSAKMPPDVLAEIRDNSYRYFERRYSARDVSDILGVDLRIIHSLLDQYNNDL